MQGTDATRGAGETPPPRQNSSANLSPANTLSGRLGIVVDGKTMAVLRIDKGQAMFAQGESETRANILLTSMDDFNRIVEGKLNIVVASLRGMLAVRGDIGFGVKAIRAIQGGLPVQGMPRGMTAKEGV